ncbi:scoloptoxin SSD14-like isoform X2 [Rhagoletis pomonella]|nr:scoloptoxin SSD14-like isoform X2 [Rhagoletis pomonella]XP_036318221.1 scoloptoxin SSD14-like isoform X2 [Rhagoletis pomonella]XP_036318222.1 scoloptoxin SSD14-like isoform X2 [Rhagoletis pomonella]
MVHSNEDALNKIPLKSASGLDDEEKNGGEFTSDTAAAEEARREQMRANILKWMKKLTIVLICFIGVALISYVIISLCFSDWSKTSNAQSKNSTAIDNDTSFALPSISNYSLSPDDDSNSSKNGALASNSTSDSAEEGSTIAELTTTTIATAAGSIAIAGFSESAATQPTDALTATVSAEPPTAPISTSATNNMPTTAQTTASSQAKPTRKALVLKDTPPLIKEKFVSKLGVYEQAAVCSDREVCSEIGSHMLDQKGSAVDAAIATLLCNGILTMHSMGIGGGMLMNIYLKDSKHAYSIDAREVAPFEAFQEMFDGKLELSLNGGLSIAVPGELMGYHRAHERFGKLPWKTLVEPAIKLCHEGFFLTHHQWSALNYRWHHMKNNTVLTDVFVNATTGQLYPVGTKIKPQKVLCETYELLAANGPLDFYNGTLAHMVVEDLKDLGSKITAYDLESYSADMVSSITMQLGDDILYAVPPVSSGTVVANILSILEGFNITKADLVGAQNEANTLHRIAEALKFGFAKRWELGDLRFNDVRELVSRLTNPEYSMSIREKINDNKVHKEIFDYGAQFMGEDDAGTSHVVVLAPDGDAVSVTSSVNEYFGASQAGRRTGIVFNSAMNDFSVAGTTNHYGLPAAPTNFIDARKRPMSSMSPMILTDQKGNVRLVLGAAGGSKIISAVVEVAARILWFGQNIKSAIDAPRIHHQLLPNVLQYEFGQFSEEVLQLLKAKGHELQPYKDIGSVVCAIARNDTAIYANADFRKRGGVAGF